MCEDVRIVEIQPLSTDKPQKTNAGYTFPVRYVLEDGRTIDTKMSNRLLRDAKKAQSELPREVGNMKAMFRDGEYIGTQISYSLTGNGWQPSEV